MRYAFIADIHGNFEALAAVMEDVRAEQPDHVFCLGDIVGYGAEPAECIRAMRENSILCIAGNHDFAVSGDLSTQYFNPIASASVDWTRQALSEKDLEFLSKLPLEFKNEVFVLTHGAPTIPGAFEYIITADDVRRGFASLDRRVSFQAHSHVPVSWVLSDGYASVVLENSFAVGEGCGAMVNVGSVGQPRDGVPTACYALFDAAEHSVEIRRIPYDIDTAARKILDAGLPEENAYRLYLGK